MSTVHAHAASTSSLQQLVQQLPFPAWLLGSDGNARANGQAQSLAPGLGAQASATALLAAWRNPDGSPIEQADSPFQRCLQSGQQVEATLVPAHGGASLRVVVLPLDPVYGNDAVALVLAERPGPAALVDWLTDVGHALRSPLSPIRTAAQLLRNPRIDADQREGLLEIVERQIRELMSRIDELSDLVRVKREAIHADPRPCDLSMLLDIVRGRVATRFEEEHRQLLLPPAPADFNVLVDQGQVVQALAQVLVHALRNTPEGGVVECRIVAEPQWTTVVVRDQDRHASAEHAAAMFAPPVDRHGAGLGAAMFLARAFIERSGGRFHAQARSDAIGMEFQVALPRA